MIPLVTASEQGEAQHRILQIYLLGNVVFRTASVLRVPSEVHLIVTLGPERV